jgi:hypothetical protein
MGAGQFGFGFAEIEDVPPARAVAHFGKCLLRHIRFVVFGFGVGGAGTQKEAKRRDGKPGFVHDGFSSKERTATNTSAGV